MALKTKVLLTGEVAILQTLLSELPVLVGAYGLLDGGEEPELMASAMEPDEGYVLALFVSTLLGQNELNVLVQIGEEDQEVGTCQIELTTQYDTPEPWPTKFEVSADVSEAAQEVGSQLAKFIAQYFASGNRDAQDRLPPMLNSLLQELIRTIPL